MVDYQNYEILIYKGKNYGNIPKHEGMTKAYKIDLEVKGQHPIWIMNVHNTSSYGDTPMCQIS